MATLPGCGSDEGRTPTYPTTGTVAREGKPAADVLVRFHPTQPAPEFATITTRTDAAGHYSLSTFEADDGAPAGEYVVSVLLDIPPADEGGDTETTPARRLVRLPARLAAFGNPTTSPLRAQIEAGANTLDFDVR